MIAVSYMADNVCVFYVVNVDERKTKSIFARLNSIKSSYVRDFVCISILV